MPFGLGFGETILIFSMLLLLFGPGKLPEIGGSLGRGIRDFKRALSGEDDDAGGTGVPELRAPTGTVATPDPVAAAMRGNAPPPAAEAAAETVVEAVVPPDADAPAPDEAPKVDEAASG
ncbi:MAG TPA: twin-arginine translocase TatA/TatE family subunit [Longimicrobiaceae bacterium]|nr:twin-arginine translocase TatA/TatE family subunit [Longimicrobiaceae bacterium]